MNNDKLGSQALDASFPSAVPVTSDQRVRSSSWMWAATLLCVGISVGLVWWSNRNTGALIQIEFRDGHGLKPDDVLRYRGMDIGRVEQIELNVDKRSVLVSVRLTPESCALVTEGSQFWIVRPVVSMDSILGLETIIGPKYLAIEPGNPSNRLQQKFVGLASPPLTTPPEGAMEILLDARTRGGLENGAPVLYRGFRIGNVLQVGLASDARTVRARCAIDPEYRELVRENSKFWIRSGWHLDVGITGIKLDADSIAQIVSGGVEMATPNTPDRIVTTGHQFVLHEVPDKEWTQWQPSIAHGPIWNQFRTNMPQPIRVALRWQERSFGFRTNKQLLGWGLPLDDGSVLCSSQYATAPANAIADSMSIEVGGQALNDNSVSTFAKLSSGNDAVRIALPARLPGNVALWPAKAIAFESTGKATDVAIASANYSTSIVLDAARLSVTPTGWDIDPTIVIDPDCQGSPVLSLSDGNVIGFYESAKNQQRIVLLSEK